MALALGSSWAFGESWMFLSNVFSPLLINQTGCWVCAVSCLEKKKKEYVSLCGIPSLAQTTTPPPPLSGECVESPQMRLGSRLACPAGWFEQEDIHTAEAQVKRLLPSQSVSELPASPTAPKPPRSPDCNTEVLASSIKYSIYRSSQLSGGSPPPRD